MSIYSAYLKQKGGDGKNGVDSAEYKGIQRAPRTDCTGHGKNARVQSKLCIPADGRSKQTERNTMSAAGLFGSENQRRISKRRLQ